MNQKEKEILNIGTHWRTLSTRTY